MENNETPKTGHLIQEGIATADGWIPAKASDVQPGDRVRTADGTEVIATRIEHAFLGRQTMIAFIEDTPERWFKRPVSIDADVEVSRPR